jgi:hypothetical protein
MNRVYPVLAFLLCLSAGWLFIELNSLPQTDILVETQTSLASLVNKSVFERLKRRTNNAIRSGRNTNNFKTRQATRELEQVSAFADTLSLTFDRVEAGEARVQSLQQKITNLNILVRSGLTVPPDFFFPPLKAGIAKLNTPDRFPDRKFKNLVLENIRYESYDILSMYVDSLNMIAEGMQVYFDTGFPHREETWKKGLISFNPPVNMELSERERIQIRISKDLHADLLKKMPTATTGTLDSLFVSDVMVVRLTGDDFDIMSFDEEEQGVTDEGYTQWEFDVTPRNTGTHALFVKVGIVYNIPGLGPTKKFFPVYERQVQIHVNEWRRAMSFATERWEFLISTFLIPALTWAWRGVKKKRGMV